MNIIINIGIYLALFTLSGFGIYKFIVNIRNKKKKKKEGTKN